MKRSSNSGICLFLLLTLFFAPNIVRADFRAADWKYSREMTLPKPGPDGFVAIAIDEIIFNYANPGLGDLRVIGPDKSEIPYVLSIFKGKVQETEYSPTIFNQAVVPEERQEFIVDLGRRGEKNNRLELLTPDKNFRRPVAVYGSDDTREWKLIRNGFYIFDFSGDVVVRDVVIRYPENIYRYLRIEIGLEKAKPISIDGVKLRLREEEPPREVVYLPVSMTREENSSLKATDLKINLGYENLPVYKIVLEVDDPEFYRTIEVYGNTERQYPIGEGTIYKYLIREYQSSELSVGFDESLLGNFLVRVFNHDNKPLAIKTIKAIGLGRFILFRPPDSGKAVLFYGNPNARGPQYDLAALYRNTGNKELTLGQLGSHSGNPDYVPPKQPRDWRWAIWLALIPAIVVMIYLVMRSAGEIKSKEGEA